MKIKYLVCNAGFVGAKKIKDLRKINEKEECILAVYINNVTRFGIISLFSLKEYVFENKKDAEKKVEKLGVHIYAVFMCTEVGG